jgi:hypothetical protein
VTYTCDRFFDCHPPARPWYPKVALAMQYGELALAIAEADHEDLSGWMFVERVPPERLPGLLRKKLRAMRREFERHVRAEIEQGCLVRPLDLA